MTEKEIRDRIKALQAEIKNLKEQLPKKERVQQQQKRESSFVRLANKIVDSKRAE